MIRFSRAARQRPANVVATDTSKTEPIDKAEALMALLGEDARKVGLATGGSMRPGPKIPEDRLRQMARQLIAQVEAGQPRTEVAPVPPAPAAPQPVASERRRLFSQAAPLQAPEPLAEQPARKPAVARPVEPVEPQGLPEGISVPSVPSREATYPVDTIRKIVKDSARVQTISAEHPLIVAFTLEGRPSLDQAAALRRLPKGQVRSVHRALRLLEGRIS